MGSIGRLGRCRVPASRARGSENKVGGGQIDAGGKEIISQVREGHALFTAFHSKLLCFFILLK